MSNPEINDGVRETTAPAKRQDNFDDVRAAKVEKLDATADAVLANTLLENKQVAPGLIIDAAISKPNMPLEQALPEILAERKEEIFKKQQEMPKDTRPQLGQMLVDEGLVTAEQVAEALEAQKALRAEGKKAPLLGELLVQQLQLHISDAKQAGTKK